MFWDISKVSPLLAGSEIEDEMGCSLYTAWESCVLPRSKYTIKVPTQSAENYICTRKWTGALLKSLAKKVSLRKFFYGKERKLSENIKFSQKDAYLSQKHLVFGQINLYLAGVGGLTKINI